MGLILVWNNPLEKGVATHSGILAWEIPRTEEPGRPQLQRVGRNLATKQQQQIYRMMKQLEITAIKIHHKTWGLSKETPM